MSRAAEAGITVLFGQLVYREASIFLGKWPKYGGRITKAINSLPRVDQLLPDLVGDGGAAHVGGRARPLASVGVSIFRVELHHLHRQHGGLHSADHHGVSRWGWAVLLSEA
jgi:hypothetical protein